MIREALDRALAVLVYVDEYVEIKGNQVLMVHDAITKAKAALADTPSEIRLVGETTIRELLSDAIDDGESLCTMNEVWERADRLLEALRPYLRTSEPVSVEAVARNLGNDFDQLPGGLRVQIKLNIQNVLNAAGIRYVD